MAVNRVLLEEYDRLDWTNVSSSNVERIAYVPDFGRIWVQFLPKPGSKHTVYVYLDQTPADWAAFQAAPSKGKFVDQHFRRRGVGYVQVL